ncbi:acyltransferase [Falsirhodobacter sp. 1013]|uniref:acyltransferase n=1 Tax=Falsirhodobacter sp. 1013 TaxID=3417566 RepID=UPI003EB979B0
MASKTTRAPPGSTRTRNGNIDGLRLIAAIGVISLHVGQYHELPPVAGDVIRSSFRWCVPFFFMLTGYYLFDPQEAKWRITIEKLAMPLRAFVVASLVFFPVLAATSGADGITLTTMVGGTYHHLWYLTALIFALLAVYTFQSGLALKLLWIFSALIVFSYVGISYFHVFTRGGYEAVIPIRDLSGIPAVLIGGWLRGVRRLESAAPLLFGIGLTVTVIEGLALSALGVRPANVQLFIGTLPLAAGLLGLAISAKDITPYWMSELGRRESLGIYLYHPLAILVAASVVSGDLRIERYDAPGLSVWILASILTIAGVLLLRIRLPRVRTALDGVR